MNVSVTPRSRPSARGHSGGGGRPPYARRRVINGLVGVKRKKHMTIRHCVRILRKPFTAVVQKVTCVRDDVPGTITGVTTRDPVAALTFDDGPHPEYTPLLLNILERYQARATFFMIGDAAQRHPDLVRQVAQGGHAIGNHSWDHPFFPSLSGSFPRL